jgi:hypothetical protein
MNKLLPYKNDKKQEALPITQFQGYYEFLSIDFPAWVYYQGFIYPSVATAFQAARTSDVTIRRKISEVKDQEEFKKMAGEIVNSGDWPQRRLKVM